MEPEVWGPSLWKFLNIICLNYPNKPTLIDRHNYSNFFNSLDNIIPCEACKYHYKLYLKQNAPNLNSRNDLVLWIIDFHNHVNKRLNKRVYSYDEAFKLIKKSMEKGTKTSYNGNNRIFILFGVFIIALIIILFIILRKKKII
jgi:hypothetical protein